jgi:hypothetical protein
VKVCLRQQAPASLRSATRAVVAEVREFEFEFGLLLLDRFPSSLLRYWDPMEDESTVTLGALPQPKAPSRVWDPMALEVTLTADLLEPVVAEAFSVLGSSEPVHVAPVEHAPSLPEPRFVGACSGSDSYHSGMLPQGSRGLTCSSITITTYSTSSSGCARARG